MSADKRDHDGDRLLGPLATVEEYELAIMAALARAAGRFRMADLLDAERQVVHNRALFATVEADLDAIEADAADLADEVQNIEVRLDVVADEVQS